MVFVDEFKAVFMYIGRIIRDLFDGGSRQSRGYLKSISIVIVLSLVAFGGYIGYRSYVVSREQAAYRSFIEYLESFQTAQQADSQQEWERMIPLLDRGYQQYKGRNVAPLFFSLKANVQLQLGQLADSIITLQEAINALPKGSPLLSLLETKQALMKLDADDEDLSKAGLAQLIVLARDDKNNLKDMALFYLGRYYWAHDQIEDAQKAWQDLEDSSWAQKAYPSPWVAQAKETVQQLAA